MNEIGAPGNLAVIPAKTRSTRFPGKNLAALGGIPLVCRAVQSALAAGVFETVLVSTDSPDIALLARDAGAEVPFTRGAELTADLVEVPAVVRHALQWFEPQRRFEWVCILQPTCPFRTAGDIVAARRRIQEVPDADVVMSVSPFEPHPQRALHLSHGQLLPDHPADAGASRQHLPPRYRPDGLIYWWRAAALLRSLDPFHGKVIPFFTPPASRLDIDYPEDLEYAEWRWSRS